MGVDGSGALGLLVTWLPNPTHAGMTWICHQHGVAAHKPFQHRERPRPSPKGQAEANANSAVSPLQD